MRKRNPVIGYVEVVPEDNHLNLNVGDKVIVNHWSFFGDIDTNRRYKIHDHIKVDDKLLFKVESNNIYFREVNGELEPLGDSLLVEETDGIEIVAGIAMEKHYTDRCRVVTGNETFKKGDLLLVKRHSLYKIEYEGKEIVKIRDKEVVGIITEEEIKSDNTKELLEQWIIDSNPELASTLKRLEKSETAKTVQPWKDCVCVKDLYKNEPDLAGTIKKEVHAVITQIGDDVTDYKVGDVVYRHGKAGIPFYGEIVLPLEEESIYFKVEDYNGN